MYWISDKGEHRLLLRFQMSYNLATEGSLPNGISLLYLFQTRLKSEIGWALFVGETLAFSFLKKYLILP